MKVLYIIILVIGITYSLNSQVTLSLYFYDPCSDTIEDLHNYVLKKDSSIYYSEAQSNIVKLPDTGNYELSTIYYDESLPYSVTDPGIFMDTIRGKVVEFMYEPTSSPSRFGYYYCSKKCDGWIIDYYPGGKKRIEGSFKDGLPLGKLKIFYPSGQLKKVDKYSKRGKLKKRTLYTNQGEISSKEKYR